MEHGGGGCVGGDVVVVGDVGGDVVVGGDGGGGSASFNKVGAKV